MQDIMHLVTIHASAAHVYQALTTADGIRNWWTRDAALDPTAGGTGVFRFHQGRSVSSVRIDALVPEARVAWTVIASFLPAWEGTTIAFELRAAGSDTVLSFAHRGFRQADEVYARTTTGWGYYLVSLQQYLETGAGAPHPDIDLARVIRPPRGRSDGPLVSLGENSKQTALPAERDAIRKFHRDVLGCAVIRTSDAIDVFQLGDGFHLGIVYEEAALSAADHMKSIWLELRTDRPAELKVKILAAGITEIDYRDKDHFYFQAPGGQVYRLASAV